MLCVFVIAGEGDLLTGGDLYAVSMIQPKFTLRNLKILLQNPDWLPIIHFHIFK